jgi:hypothetical protein
MYEVAAKIPGFGTELHNIGCFDPTIIICRLRKSFPEAVVNPEDFAWRDYDSFRRRGAIDGAVRIAESDARRRGPIWTFTIPTGPERVVRGKAERYVVSIFDTEPIPADLKSRFLSFLEELKFAPFVEVSSIRIEGNEIYPD